MRHFVRKVFLFLIMMQLVFSNSASAQNWDVELLKGINPENPNSTFWLEISNSAYWVPFAAPLGTLGYGVLKDNRQARLNSMELLLNVGVNSLIFQGLKYSFHRTRPGDKYPGQVFPNSENHDGLSFPSGHASMVFATATTLALDYKKWYVVVPAYVWAGSVGYSRMYLGKHYPSDVVAGAIVGIGSGYLSHWLNKKLFKPKLEKPNAIFD